MAPKDNDDGGQEEFGENIPGIEPVELQTEMERSFIDYAMSVITSRAIPDARDGMKPVHRRILWSMHEMGVRSDRPHVKCAKVVGEVMGNYHPHGDSAIYEALVRLGQDFSLRNVLIDKHGNFGSPDDPPAASRYPVSYTHLRKADLARQVTTVGPHRDELELLIDGMSARTHASQGEQRTLTLALRLAGHRLITEKIDSPPILLLDDVFSELDDDRARRLVTELPACQTFLTTATAVPSGLQPQGLVWVEGGVAR